MLVLGGSVQINMTLNPIIAVLSLGSKYYELTVDRLQSSINISIIFSNATLTFKSVCVLESLL